MNRVIIFYGNTEINPWKIVSKTYQTVKIKILSFHSINKNKHKRAGNLHIWAHK